MMRTFCVTKGMLYRESEQAGILQKRCTDCEGAREELVIESILRRK